ncbi:hypothetical protein MOSE0_F05930 [Monosporozyma servazzii]
MSRRETLAGDPNPMLKARLWAETLQSISSIQSSHHTTDGFDNALVEIVLAQLQATARKLELLGAHSSNNCDNNGSGNGNSGNGRAVVVRARDWRLLELLRAVDSDTSTMT